MYAYYIFIKGNLLESYRTNKVREQITVSQPMMEIIFDEEILTGAGFEPAPPKWLVP